MKKTLIALAALGALTSVAQAQSSVALYGLLDSGVRHDSAAPKNSAGATGTQNMFTSGILNTSRFGFRGTGFVVGDGSLVATNFHVLPPAGETKAARMRR